MGLFDHATKDVEKEKRADAIVGDAEKYPDTNYDYRAEFDELFGETLHKMHEWAKEKQLTHYFKITLRATENERESVRTGTGFGGGTQNRSSLADTFCFRAIDMDDEQFKEFLLHASKPIMLVDMLEKHFKGKADGEQQQEGSTTTH